MTPASSVLRFMAVLASQGCDGSPSDGRSCAPVSLLGTVPALGQKFGIGGGPLLAGTSPGSVLNQAGLVLGDDSLR